MKQSFEEFLNEADNTWIPKDMPEVEPIITNKDEFMGELNSYIEDVNDLKRAIYESIQGLKHTPLEELDDYKEDELRFIQKMIKKFYKKLDKSLLELKI